MIVKNESRVIIRLLDSVVKLLDGYCICDTGSTDNTIFLITEYFKEHNIPGKIVQEPFKDFGYNRTLALKHAYKKTKYLFIFDSDDKIIGNLILPKIIDKDSYFFKFGKFILEK
jgi:glycosyltransferase involved in cell wall biosynthesis